MDTKLKKINYLPIVKTIAFLLVIIGFAFSVATITNLIRNVNGLESLSKTDYMNTNELFNYQHNFYIGLNNLLKYKNAEFIKQGNTLDKTELENRKKEVFSQWYYEIVNQMNRFSNENIDLNQVAMFETYSNLKEKFEKDNADRIAEIYKSMVQNHLNEYYSLLDRVNNKEGLYYYATNGEFTLTNCEYNTPEQFTQFKSYYLYDNNGLRLSENMNENRNHYTDYSEIGENKVYIAVKDEYIAKKQSELDAQRIYLKNGLSIILISVAIAIISFIFLLLKAGRKDEGSNVSMMGIDGIYTDINLWLIFGTILAWGGMSAGLIQDGFLNYKITAMQVVQPDFWIFILFNMICSSVVLMFVLSLARHFKNSSMIKHSIIYKACAKIKNAIKTILNAGPLSLRISIVIAIFETVVFVFGLIVASSNGGFSFFTILLLLIVSAAVMYFTVLKIKPFAEIVKGVQEIRSGNLEHAITIEGNGDLATLANNINDIADGLKNAVSKEIRAERMKSELITNVSHDLKTPLTSIINYADLLSKEKLTPEVANEYVAVLKQKSEKLKTLTQDLFEISKAQSGNISVDLERLDIAVLLKQSLAEYDEQIGSSGLEFKVNVEDTDTAILADGKRLSRVFENLIGNTLKYSLPNTRVYVDVFNDKNSVIVEMKNIANYEMNFKEDEILERFVRGDNSRSTEGNGLGLAIAQSYIEACGGKLKISVDGDLFKVIIKFERMDR